MGLRQLGHPVQGVRPNPAPRAPVREDRRRRQGARAHRARAIRRAAHPVGPRRRLRRAACPRRRPRGPARHHQLQHLPGRRLQARRPDATSTRADAGQKAIDHHSTASTSWTRPGRATSRSGWPRARTTRARATCAIGRTGWPSRSPRSTSGSATHQRLVLEYKFFEPAFYSHRRAGLGYGVRPGGALGERAVVCLDTGHHAPGTNIEFIVTQLLRLGKLGSFDFNSRFYADDDLIVGAADPFQLFRILYEVIRGGGYGPANPDERPRVHARPVPQHRGQDPRPDPVGAQRAGDDGAGAARRPRRCRSRRRPATCSARTGSSWTPSTPTSAPTSPPGARSRGLPADPMKAYAESGYQKQIEADRVGGAQAGWS